MCLFGTYRYCGLDPMELFRCSRKLCFYNLQRCCLHTGSECTKTLCALFCLSVSAFCNFFLLTVIHDLVPKEPLPDLVFMIVPQQRWAWSVGDVFSTLKLVFSLYIQISEGISPKQRRFSLQAISSCYILKDYLPSLIIKKVAHFFVIAM